MDYSFRGFYINLDECVERKLFIEKQLENHKVSNLYTRFKAFNKDEIVNHSNALYDTEIACKTSHIEAMKSSNRDFHLHILEDDVKFCDNHFEILEKSIGVLDDSWDVIFTGVFLGMNQEQISALVKLRDKDNSFRLVSLKNFLFAGGFSYVINKKSIDKVINICESSDIDRPIDLVLRDAINTKDNLQTNLIFPMISLHGGYFDSSMTQRDAEVDYEFQYLFEEPLVANYDLNFIMDKIEKYANKKNIELQNKECTLENIYSHLFMIGNILFDRKNKTIQ